MPTLWSRIFGPSTTDRLLSILEADRAAVAAQQEQMVALMTQIVAQQASAAAVAAQQLQLLTPPAGEPIVRVMNSAAEATYERQRAAESDGPGFTELDTDSLLTDLQKHIFAESRSNA